MGVIRAINISPKKGMVKVPVDHALLRVDHGIEGDAHAGTWHRQVSLPPLADVRVGSRVRAGDALLEVTQIGKKCHNGCVIREVTGDCIMPREGIFCRVLEGGPIEPGTDLDFIEAMAS